MSGELDDDNKYLFGRVRAGGALQGAAPWLIVCSASTRHATKTMYIDTKPILNRTQNTMKYRVELSHMYGSFDILDRAFDVRSTPCRAPTPFPGGHSRPRAA